jgi:hypothetical protein
MDNESREVIAPFNVIIICKNLVINFNSMEIGWRLNQPAAICNLSLGPYFSYSSPPSQL